MSKIKFFSILQSLYHILHDIFIIYMEINIQDDPSVIQPIFDQLKQNINLNIVQDLKHREQTLKRLMEGYEALKPQFDQALKHDLGYSPFMANFGAHSIALGQISDIYHNFKKWAEPRSVPTPISLGLASCEVLYQPLGLALVISSWNYPIYTSLPQVAAAICAGNCVILKPSELSPYCSNVLKKLFDKYLDPRFYQVIEGKITIAKSLTKLKFDIICFTGSTETGKLVAIEAAKNLTPCILQLGGKCPVIIDESADLQSASKRIIFGKFLNCGQTCVGVDHLFIHQSVYEKFKKIFLKTVKQSFDNSDIIDSGDYGKINNKNHFKRLQRFFKEEHGGKTLYGGNLIEQKLHFSPTVVEKPSKQSSMMKNQIFGPILPIFSYSDIKTLVSDIRSKPKPLVVYLFSSKSQNITFVKQNTSSGAFVVNDTVVQLLNCHLPFGGVGQSGYGRYHGQSGFIAFSNAKSLCNTKAFDAYPLSNRFMPYDESKKRAMTFLLKSGGLTYTALKKKSAILGLIIAGAIAYAKMRPHL